MGISVVLRNFYLYIFQPVDSAKLMLVPEVWDMLLVIYVKCPLVIYELIHVLREDGSHLFLLLVPLHLR
jgi:hypothetical protein